MGLLITCSQNLSWHKVQMMWYLPEKKGGREEAERMGERERGKDRAKPPLLAHRATPSLATAAACPGFDEV